MILDDVSFDVVSIALYLNRVKVGSVSEVWIPSQDIDRVNARFKDGFNVRKTIASAREKIAELYEKDRKQYLTEILTSLEFQFSTESHSLGDYYEKCYGYRIERVTDEELAEIERYISWYEDQVGKDRFQIHKEHRIAESELLPTYQRMLERTKARLPAVLTDIEGSTFSFQVVHNKPWVAFNSHTAPFSSKLFLNADANLTDVDLLKFSQHEAWGGHHSELSLKDKLLMEDGKGEHGLVITNSPQVFVSEGIAEGMLQVYRVYDYLSDEQKLLWHYYKKILALHNLVAHLYFDDNYSKTELREELKKYNIGQTGIDVVINFSTDIIFGRYSAVYHSATKFIVDIEKRLFDRNDFLAQLYTKPCTPKMLREKFYVDTDVDYSQYW